MSPVAPAARRPERRRLGAGGGTPPVRPARTPARLARRLSFDFTVPKYSTQHTRVTIVLVPTGDTGSELTLTQEGVAEGWEEKTREGWAGILEGLAGALRS